MFANSFAGLLLQQWLTTQGIFYNVHISMLLTLFHRCVPRDGIDTIDDTVALATRQWNGQFVFALKKRLLLIYFEFRHVCTELIIMFTSRTFYCANILNACLYFRLRTSSMLEGPRFVTSVFLHSHFGQEYARISMTRWNVASWAWQWKYWVFPRKYQHCEQNVLLARIWRSFSISYAPDTWARTSLN